MDRLRCGSERRRFVRKTTTEADGAECIYPLQDVSEEGLCLLYPRPRYTGEMVYVEFQLRGRTIRAHAEVCWVQKEGPRPLDHRVGLRFVELAAGDRVEISRFVAA